MLSSTTSNRFLRTGNEVLNDANHAQFRYYLRNVFDRHPYYLT